MSHTHDLTCGIGRVQGRQVEVWFTLTFPQLTLGVLRRLPIERETMMFTGVRCGCSTVAAYSLDGFIKRQPLSMDDLRLKQDGPCP